MGIKTKTTLGASFVGVVAMAAAAFGQAGGETPSDEQRPRGERRRPAAERRDPNDCGARRAHPRARRVVHSETKVQLREGFAVVTVDHGTVTDIDHSAKKITIKRADGETVTATAVDETKVCKDGSKAAFDAVKEGDLARLVQVRSERFTGLRAIFARTPGAESDAPATDPPARARPSALGESLDDLVMDPSA